jgi:hypothetical protein
LCADTAWFGAGAPEDIAAEEKGGVQYTWQYVGVPTPSSSYLAATWDSTLPPDGDILSALLITTECPDRKARDGELYLCAQAPVEEFVNREEVPSGIGMT